MFRHFLFAMGISAVDFGCLFDWYKEHRGSDAPYLHKKTVFVNCRFPKTGDIIADIPETVRERIRSQYGKTGGNDQKNAHFIF